MVAVRSIACAVAVSLLLPASAHPLGSEDPPAVPRGTVIPAPPRQHDPWVPPRAAVSPAFVSAVTSLFDQGLPDPRGCEFREVAVVRGFGILSRDRQVTEPRHGWLLPGKGQRFAILPDGVVYPVYHVGKAASLREDLKGDPTRIKPLLLCFLLRLGAGDLVDAYQRGLLGARAGHWLYSDPASDWEWSLFDAGVKAHMRADDVVALYYFRFLSRVAPHVDAEALRRGYVGVTGEPDERPSWRFADELPALLADQERRARKPKAGVRQELIGLREERIRKKIQDLDEVDEQALVGDNPGWADVSGDPRVRSLVTEGEDAVEPLIDCLAEDRRLTRSVAYWRFFTHRGEMIAVSDAAYTALCAILGGEALEKLKPPDSPGPDRASQADYRRRFAAAIRMYWAARRGLAPLPGRPGG